MANSSTAAHTTDREVRRDHRANPMGAYVATAGVVVFLVATFLDWVSTNGDATATGSGYETDTEIGVCPVTFRFPTVPAGNRSPWPTRALLRTRPTVRSVGTTARTRWAPTWPPPASSSSSSRPSWTGCPPTGTRPPPVPATRPTPRSECVRSRSDSRPYRRVTAAHGQLEHCCAHDRP